MMVSLRIQLRDGTSGRYLCSTSPSHADALRGNYVHGKVDVEFELLEKVLSAQKIERRDVSGFSISLTVDEVPRHRHILVKEGFGTRRFQGVTRCRSILGIAKVVLPKNARQDAFDEWMDEIECLAAEDRPVLRRAISIVFRALPRLALRSRLPTRVRKPGSE